MNSACLNLRTENSVGAAVARTDDLLDRAREYRFAAVGRADRATLLGVEAFARGARRRGLHPVVGVELDLVSIFEADVLAAAGSPSPITFPIVLFAETDFGYRNLVRLVSGAHTRAATGTGGSPAAAGLEHPHERRGAGRPFVTLADLEANSRGLIAQSPGLDGEVSSRIMRGQADLAERLALRLAGVFGSSSFLLGIANHGQPLEARLADDVAALARRTGLGIVAANEVDHLDPEDRALRDLRAAIHEGRVWTPAGSGGAGSHLRPPAGLDSARPASHLRPPAELRRLFHDYPEALDRAAELAQRCQVEPERQRSAGLRYVLPPGRTEAAYLASLCVSRLPDDLAYRRRLERELDAITRRELSGYFLTLWDFARQARSQEAAVGPGRGALTSSLVAYLLGITEIDPVAHGLYFERLLSESEQALPDLVLEVDARRRDEMVAYLEHRHGPDRVAQAAEVLEYTPHTAVRDVGRALQFSEDEISETARRMPDIPDGDMTPAVAHDPRLARQYRQDERVRAWLDLARRLQGLPREVTARPGGVIIAAGPIEDVAPVQMGPGEARIAQLDWGGTPRLGLVRIDLGGDPRVAAELRGVSRLIREIRPHTFEDLVTAVSLHRLAGRGRVLEERFLKRRRGQESAQVAEPLLGPILEPTEGLLLDQEQLVAAAMAVAGFTAEEAEEFRRHVVRLAAGEDTPAGTGGGASGSLLAPWRIRFVKAAVECGLAAPRAEEIFLGLVHAGRAAVNRADSVADALLIYRSLDRAVASASAQVSDVSPTAGAVSRTRDSGTDSGRSGRMALVGRRGRQGRPEQMDLPWGDPTTPGDAEDARRTGTDGVR